jgi:hypothetical protein
MLKEKYTVSTLDGVRIVVFVPPPRLNLTVSPLSNLVKIAQLRLEYFPSHASF